MAEVIQNPPEARGIDAAALVVHDHARRVPDAEARHHPFEVRRRRQERGRILRVADGLRRQVNRAGDVTLAVPAAAHVDDADRRVGGVGGDPVGLDEQLRMCVRRGDEHEHA